jgi:D-amino peptidase
LKLLIAVDMEGTSGVTTWDQVTPGHAEWQRFRRIMTADVNAAIAGAFAGGAGEVVVADGHWNGDNLLIEELDSRARLNTGSPSPWSMVQGGTENADAAFFIGYHARNGTAHAILDHTWSAARVHNLYINGRLSGEVGLNGSVLGHYGVPVLLVSGDQAVGAEAREWIAGVETVTTKIAHGRWSAEVLPPELVRERLQAAGEQAVRRYLRGAGPRPLETATPVKITLELVGSDMGDKAALLPGAVRLDGRTIEFSASDMPAAYLAFRAAVTLALRT